MTLSEFLLARLEEDIATARAGQADDPDGFNTFPATRIIADIAAKRRIVALHAEAASHTLAHGAPTNHEARAGALADVIQLLAQAYAGHPDFQEGWKL